MKKILLVGGDSFSDQYCRSYADTDIITWPILLAEKLDMTLKCVAQSGAGNEQIYSSVLDYISSEDPDNIGMVITGWSKAERLDYELTHYTKKSGPVVLKDTKYDFKREYWHNTRVAPRGDIHGWIKKSARNFYSLQLLCEFHNIPYKQFQMISLFSEYVSEYCSTDFKDKRLDCINSLIRCDQYDLINKENFIGWPIYNEAGGFVVGDVTVHQDWKHYNKLANDIPTSSYYNSASNIPVKSLNTPKREYVVGPHDSHPNKAGHELIMEFIYENL